MCYSNTEEKRHTVIIIMKNAVIRGTPGFPALLGNAILAGPQLCDEGEEVELLYDHGCSIYRLSIARNEPVVPTADTAD